MAFYTLVLIFKAVTQFFQRIPGFVGSFGKCFFAILGPPPPFRQVTAVKGGGLDLLT